MTVSIPSSVVAEAMVSARFVPAIAALPAITVAEYNAGKEMTCFFPANWDGVTVDQTKNEQSRMCSALTWEVLGTTKRSIANIVYTYLPQTIGTDPGNLLYTALQPGLTGFLVVRYGKAATGIGVTGDKVDVFGITLGERWKHATGENESAPLVVEQGISSTGVVAIDSVLT